MSLLWLPLITGWLMGKGTGLEGMTATSKGARDMVGGACVGATGGLGLTLLGLLINTFDIRDPLVNWSPQTLDILSFGGGVGVVVVWIAICAALGAVGGALHIMAPKVATATIAAILTVLMTAIFETFIVDVVSWLKFLYAKTDGLKLFWALVLAALSVAFTFSGGSEQLSRVKADYNNRTGPDKSMQTAVLIAVSTGVLIIIPIFAGRITQELMANIGIFLLRLPRPQPRQ
ncbi:MAG: hypothetical protein GY773_19620, partial [Actinomycetia bacterium]|nr:hypothetical protein [Actinomycetes bacterium]